MFHEKGEHNVRMLSLVHEKGEHNVRMLSLVHEKGEHNVRMLLLLSYISEISKISALHK